MKRLIVCCDGTWNAADSSAAQTNVFKLACAISAHDAAGMPQIVSYLRGVGTTGLAIGDVLQGALGLGIEETIRSAYMFLSQNYEQGDEIFLFGFSRGAFTARSLAGFMHCSGLLQRHELHGIERAWTYYREHGGARPVDFIKDTGLNSQSDVPIKMLGVWDTVGALGVPGALFAGANAQRYRFHSTGPCSTVKHGYHALAIDEHRDQFVPTLWTGEVPTGSEIEQVWFAGVHSDVGGGYLTREIADIPLAWMARRAEQCGLALDWSLLPGPAERLNALAAVHNSESGLFAVDRFRPTLRQVCGAKVDVGPFERLYVPLDENGAKVTIINERIHASVAERFGRVAALCHDDTNGTTVPQPYRPKTLDALFDAQDQPNAGVLIAQQDALSSS